MPSVSVIIPTHNRCASVRRLLDTLKIQSYPADKMEVIIVADGCVDDTVSMVKSYKAPFVLKVVEQSGQGAAIARNAGATQSSGSLLLFLDDDIESSPQIVESHVKAHQVENKYVAIGYLPPKLSTQRGLFYQVLRNYWEDTFHKMRQRNHRFTYQDLLSGNFSLASDLFRQVGGFDETFRCREDYELGVRLLKTGACFIFAGEAMGYHHDMTELKKSLRRKLQEGLADVQLGRKHPELRNTLPLANLDAPRTWLSYISIFLAFNLPWLGDFLSFCLQQLFTLLELAHLRYWWSRLLGGLLDYWYWRGVATELSSRQGWISFLQGATLRINEPNSELELDLEQGLVAAEQAVDHYRPNSLRIRYGQQPVGYIAPQPGMERLRGAHLRPLLATTLAHPLLVALALGKVVQPEVFLVQAVESSPTHLTN